MKKLLLYIFLSVSAYTSLAEDGYELWLRYPRISNAALLAEYKKQITGIYIADTSAMMNTATKELVTAIHKMTGVKPAFHQSILHGSIIIGKAGSPVITSLPFKLPLQSAGDEGFVIRQALVHSKNVIIIAANADAGLLYGAFHFLRLLQTEQPLRNLDITSAPKLKLRLLNHWDNLNRHVERGYAGISIWDWHRLPGYIDERYTDYARALASVGINGTALTNVNANALVLTPLYLEKVKALAAIFRAYNVKVYLTARFSAPVEIGGLKSADPLDPEVQQWWKNKTAEIYQYIPDFGGFLVKANSEGQPGPQNYGRSHADGANMLADAVAPHGGIVMWRAFVYSNETPDDRFKQAYNEFKPLDGQFRKNVLVQVKNGPIDFQPREPFHPLFGAMPQTPLMMEFQLTQEYLGFATHLVFLPSLFREVLDADTHAKGKGATVAKVIDGSLHDQSLTGMAGVANIGNDRNWTGHLFGQANWYALGRLAWDHTIGSEQLAEEWIRQTFTNNRKAVDTIKQIMLESHEALVSYMTPLGLHHIMGYGHHYGPAPWFDKASRADWNCTYFHRADAMGIGFDRTATGSNALSQYAPAVQQHWNDSNRIDDRYLLWFHHVAWNHKLSSGRTLWEELCWKYNNGVQTVRRFQQQWKKLSPFIDSERHKQVKMMLQVQQEEAVWWRNACLLYFQTFSKMPIPANYEQPDKSLAYYMSLRFPYAPGN
jgi:alpha-glucuronidase